MNLPGVYLIRIIIIWKWCAACIQSPKTFSSDIKFLLILPFAVSSSTRQNSIRTLKCWFSWFACSGTLGLFIRGKIRRVLQKTRLKQDTNCTIYTSLSYLIRPVLAKPRLIFGELCRLHGKFASYLRRILCKTRLIFPHINGPIVFLKGLFLSSFNIPKTIDKKSWPLGLLIDKSFPWKHHVSH